MGCAVSDGFFNTLLDYCEGQIVAILQAYFDESQRKTGLLCVAGFVFAAPQAKKFSKEFSAVFGRYGGFHMVDLVARRQGFKGISEADRDLLIREAVRIVAQRFTYGVAVAANVAEYDAIAPKFMTGFKSPYSFLCHMAMTAVPLIARKHSDPSPVTYIFEAGHSDRAEAEAFVGLMGTTEESRKHYRYSGHAFLPKADAIPLQAADLLAWEVGKFRDETLPGYRDFRKSLEALTEGRTKRYHWSFLEGPTLRESMQQIGEQGLQQIQEYKDGKRDGRVREIRRKQ
jgi:hypothetical protein